MKIRLFAEMKQFEVLNESSLNEGDRFLYGQKMIHQKEVRKVGDMVTYYLVISKKPNGNIEYKPVYDKLEE